MRIIHCSDTHGTFPQLPDYLDGDIVISSGDFFPNKSRGNRNIEPSFQTNWLKENLSIFKEWLGKRPFLFCSGNHDFIDPTHILEKEGIQATNLDNKLITYQNLTLYGFPYVPYQNGEWNFEKVGQDMKEELNKMRNLILNSENKMDILVCHCPPYGIFDLYHNCHYGNNILTDWLDYGDDVPKYILCGHVHSASGMENYPNLSFENTILISNAAQTINIINIKEK